MLEPGEVSPRSARRRRAGAIAMYNDVFLRLLLAALVTFVVIFGLAFVYVMPKGSTARVVTPTLDAFLRRASTGDSVGARALLSEELLRSDRVDDIDALLRRPQGLYGYQGLTVRRFSMDRRDSASAPDLATVSARVEFGDGRPGSVDAVLVLENEAWRINDLLYTPPVTTP